MGLLVSGGPIVTVVAPPGCGRDLGRLARFVAEAGVTRLTIVPSLLSAVLRNVDGVARLLGGLRLLICSGEALPAPLTAEVAAVLPEMNSNKISTSLSRHMSRQDWIRMDTSPSIS